MKIYDAALSTPEAGIFRHWEETEGGGVSLVTRQDVGGILDENRKLQNEGDGYSPSREVRRVASIPAIVQEQWIRRYGYNPVTATDKTLLRKLLNDSDWAYLRTAPGRL